MDIVRTSLEGRYAPGGLLTKAKRTAVGLAGGDFGGLSGRDYRNMEAEKAFEIWQNYQRSFAGGQTVTTANEIAYSMGSSDDIKGQAGTALGNAVAAKLDADLTALGTAFSQTECGAGNSLALSHIFGAMRQLKAASAPMPYNLVLSPKQVWGAKGLISLLHDDAVTGSNAKPMSLMGSKGDEAFQVGFVGSIAGFNVYWSDQIDENVSSGGDAAGFAFSQGAIGLGVGAEGLFRVREERDEMLRAVNYVCTGFWGETEVKDAYGVYILSDVS